MQRPDIAGLLIKYSCMQHDKNLSNGNSLISKKILSRSSNSLSATFLNDSPKGTKKNSFFNKSVSKLDSGSSHSDPGSHLNMDSVSNIDSDHQECWVIMKNGFLYVEPLIGLVILYPTK